jgi:acyl carrier protein
MQHQDILNSLMEIIKKRDHAAVMKTKMRDVNGDSLDKVEIVMEIEEKFGIDIDDSSQFLDSSIFAVATMIHDEIGENNKSETIKFEDMVRGLAKPGQDIINEMTVSKGVALQVTLSGALSASKNLDRMKKYVIYGKENAEREPAQKLPFDFDQRIKTPEQAHKLHMAIGMLGEAGEILEAVVNEIITGVRDNDNEIEESGDLSFYHEGYRQVCGITREQALAANIAKLGKRYLGHKYTDEQAVARADKIAQSGDAHDSPRATTADLDMRDKPGLP